MSLYGNILSDFTEGNIRKFTIKQIFDFYGITKNSEKDIVRDCLNKLENDDKIAYVDGKFVLFEDAGFIKGTIKGNERGFAFLIPEDSSLNDYFIPNKSLNGALHGDTVYCRHVQGDRGSSDEAVVTKIIKRGVVKLVGTFFSERNYGFVRPDDKNYFVDIFVPAKKCLQARTGDKVFVSITAFPKGQNPEGEITEVLGRQYDLMTEELSIIKNAGYSESFPENVIKVLDKIPTCVLDKDLENRLDLRDKRIFTIDGDDSKDFDDAVSIEINGSGNYVLGVHIADVSYYVTPNSPIDKEAFLRGNSVYFPDRVIPMLPEQLSNGICSLNEGVDRLAVSCIMEIDSDGNVVDKNISRSVIRSCHRLTYKKVQAIYDGDTELIKTYNDIVDDINEMYVLRGILSDKRKEQGSINLEVNDGRVYLDDKGEIVVEPTDELLSYNLIEEFMLVTNRTVAEYLYYADIPSVYRIHETPATEKVETFVKFLQTLGENVRFSANGCHPKEFQTVLERVKDKPYYPVVNKVMLRTMQKARYSTDNTGHFGLSAKNYCHFTSPIRRYPDLIVHRALLSLLDGTACDKYDYLEKIAHETSENASVTERKADEVERNVDDLYKAKYMLKYRNYEADGVISGVTDFGVFVELANGIEGIIRLEDLPKGRYVYDEERFKLYSTKYSFTLGESVTIWVIGVDLHARRVEFGFVKKL